MQPFLALEHLPDSELIAQVHKLAQSERLAIAKLVAALGEMDARRLYLGQGCSSMFTYCTQVLHLSEHAAFNRIEAARVARRFPTILDMLADGRIQLSAIRLLAPHLTEANHKSLLFAFVPSASSGGTCKNLSIPPSSRRSRWRIPDPGPRIPDPGPRLFGGCR